MKRTYGLAIAALAVGGGLSLAGTPGVRFEIERIELLSVGINGVQLSVTPKIEASRSLKLRSTTFEELRMNGIPFHVAPLLSRVELTANTPQALPALAVDPQSL